MKGNNGSPRKSALHSSATATATGLCFTLHNRLFLFLSCFAFASLLSIFYLANSSAPSPTSSGSSSLSSPANFQLPLPVFHALVHYASVSNDTGRMPEPDIRAISAVLRRRGPCNLLVFGIGPETPLWIAINSGGRTVFLDENQFYIAYLEERHPGLEAYDVAYTTRVRDYKDLLAAARSSTATDCRPVQNLLFSDCRLAVNDLPNQLYDIPWDVILVDGPSGYSPTSPGRMSSIYTAAVMARSGARQGAAHVFVHDSQYEVERLYAEEFLCEENRRANSSSPTLSHYLIRRGAVHRDRFCDSSPGSSIPRRAKRRRPTRAPGKKLAGKRSPSTTGVANNWSH